jgi:hypothetical protein
MCSRPIYETYSGAANQTACFQVIDDTDGFRQLAQKHFAAKPLPA